MTWVISRDGKSIDQVVHRLPEIGKMVCAPDGSWVGFHPDNALDLGYHQVLDTGQPGPDHRPEIMFVNGQFVRNWVYDDNLRASREASEAHAARRQAIRDAGPILAQLADRLEGDTPTNGSLVANARAVTEATAALCRVVADLIQEF